MVESKTINFSDEKVFKREYERYFIPLKHFAMHYIREEEIVRDILQDFFVKLWQKKIVFENDSAFRVYLYNSVRNNCLVHIRNHKRACKRLEDYQQEEFEEDVVNKIIEAEVFAMINKVFEELPDSCKKVYRLSLEGKSQKEIAEELNIAINTIKSHKNRANHYLRKRLEKLEALFLILLLINS